MHTTNAKLFIFLILWGWLSFGCLIAESFDKNKVSMVCINSDGGNINIEATKLLLPTKGALREFFCGEKKDSEIQYIFFSLKIKAYGQNVFIPISAISDFYNPNKITFEPGNKKTYKLIINGGFKTSGYTYELYFRENNLIKKKIFNNDCPETGWQETKYSWCVEEYW